VDRVVLGGVDGATLIDGLSDDVHDAAQAALSDWDADGLLCVDHALTSYKTFCGIHGNGADCVLSQVLGDFEDETDLVALDLEGVEDGGQVAVELHVNDGTDDLSHLAG